MNITGETNLPELTLITDIVTFTNTNFLNNVEEYTQKVISPSNISRIEKYKLNENPVIRITFINREEPIYIKKDMVEVLDMIRTDVYSYSYEDKLK